VPMKFFILFLFPAFLQAQAYRLDSTRYTSANEFILDRYVYITPRDFTVYHTGYHTAGFIYNDFREYKDSLLTKWTIITDEGDTVFWNYTYDDLNRLVSEYDYKQDTLTYADVYTYFQNTDLVLTRNSYSINHLDTIHHYYEWHEYDDLLRTTFSSSLSLRYDTLYYFQESFYTHPDDFTSYGLHHSKDHEGVLDTSYSKSYNYPDQYFGDTVRISHDFFTLAKDSSVIYADNLTEFTWGDYYQFEDAGDWAYLHGIIYGNYQDYEATPEGYTFKYYESPWVEANPENWRQDIRDLVSVIGNGSITVNDAGLPLLKKLHWKENNFDAQTEYFYTQLNGINELPIEPHLNSNCRIINQLDPALLYYDLSGRLVTRASGNQYLLEKRRGEINRVLYLSR
jgi:hypothetical protein